MSGSRKRKRDAAATEVLKEVSDVCKQIHTANFSTAAEWMNKFLAQDEVLTIPDTELVMASYIYAQSNAEEVKLFACEEYGLTYQMPEPRRVNQLVGKDYLASHCTRFLEQYRSVIVQCRESFKQPFFRLFADYFDNYVEARSFDNIYDFAYPEQEQPIPTAAREDLKHSNTAAMVNHLRNTDYVIITGAGVSSAIVSRADQDSARCAGSWEGLVQVLKRNIETFVDSTTRWYFALWYANFDSLPMVEKGTVLYKMVKVFNLYHGTSIDYTRFVYDAFARVAPSGDLALPNAIASRHVPIATTNYDMLLEKCLGRFEFNLTRECDESPYAAKYATKSAAKAKAKAVVLAKFTKPNHRHHIYHLHGVWYSDTKLTLGVEYAAMDDHFHTAMAILTAEDALPVVFLGTKSGVFDPHFQPLLRKSQQQHYMIVRDAELDNMVQAISDAGLVDVLVPVVYGSRYEDLAPFINDVLPQRPEVTV